MISLKPLIIESNPSDDEGLASVYFEFENHKYLTLCYNADEEEEIYIEKDDQSKSVYSNDLIYMLDKTSLELTISREVSKALDTETHIKISFDIDNKTYTKLKKTLAAIFSAKD